MESKSLETLKAEIASRSQTRLKELNLPLPNNFKGISKQDLAGRFMAIASRMMYAAVAVVESTEDSQCQTNAWQLALARLELCQLLYGEGYEPCYQQFQTDLAAYLAACPPDGGGTGG